MKKENKKAYWYWIILCEILGALSGFLSIRGIQEYNQSAVKPVFSPPSWLFPVVWGILFALMGFSAAKIKLAQSSRKQKSGLNLFIVQLILNFFWTPIFFNLRAYGLSLFWLIVLWIVVFAMIQYFIKIDQAAGFLQIPYLIWLSFALYLNYSVLKLNS